MQRRCHPAKTIGTPDPARSPHPPRYHFALLPLLFLLPLGPLKFPNGSAPLQELLTRTRGGLMAMSPRSISTLKSGALQSPGGTPQAAGKKRSAAARRELDRLKSLAANGGEK